MSHEKLLSKMVTNPEQHASLYQARRQGTMYGMLLESVQGFIQSVYSEDSWTLVANAAGLANTEFNTHKRYSDATMVNLAQACSDVIGIHSKDQWLNYFGRCFVAYFTHYGYDVILRVSGRHFRDCLYGIDNLHETMRFTYPKMVSPSFYVTQEDRNGCMLHYRSKRVGFTHYVLGQLRQCAKQFYNVHVDIRVVEEKMEEVGQHVIYRLDFDNSAFQAEVEKIKPAGPTQFPHISAATFFKVFPFTMVFDRSLTVTHAGRTVQNLLYPHTLIGQNIQSFFRLRRPPIAFTWDNVFCLQKVVFELRSLKPVYYTAPVQNNSVNNKGRAAKLMMLKGQMRYMKDFNGMAFMCTPMLVDLEDMQTFGLYLNDLNMFDTSRDMVLGGWHNASRLEFSIEKQLEHSEQISANMAELANWKQRSEALLYSMMPKEIAHHLRSGTDPIETCQFLEKVTILFTYLLGFNELISCVAPLQLVEFINSMFAVFDVIVDKYNVFKVETLGDAVYMVAGGALNSRDHQAQNVAAVALDFMQKVKLIPVPDKKHTLQLRAGMHTGSVVAGVVGKKMPQYCLFGDTVNTASRMQIYSEPGCVHISETCNDCLHGTDFVTMSRGKVNIKGKGDMRTYWLLGRRSDPDITTRIRLFRSRHTLGLQLQIHRPLNTDLNFRLIRNKSEVCVFELTPLSPAPSAGERPRSRSLTESTDPSLHSLSAANIREEVDDVFPRKALSNPFLNEADEEYCDSVTTSDPEQDTSVIEELIQTHRQKMTDVEKRIEKGDSELPRRKSWFIGGESSDASDVEEGCPFGFGVGTAADAGAVAAEEEEMASQEDRDAISIGLEAGPTDAQPVTTYSDSNDLSQTDTIGKIYKVQSQTDSQGQGHVSRLDQTQCHDCAASQGDIVSPMFNTSGVDIRERILAELEVDKPSSYQHLRSQSASAGEPTLLTVIQNELLQRPRSHSMQRETAFPVNTRGTDRDSE